MGQPCPISLIIILAIGGAPLMVSSGSGKGFIRASNGRFVDEDCNDFVVTGLNTWQLMEVAAGKVKSKPVKTAKGYADVVQWTMATAISNHLNVLRAFGHGVDSSFPLQQKSGKYSEQAFSALDYILDEASKVGVRLILTMADNWSPVDSKTQYVSWSATARASGMHVLTNGLMGESGEPDAFFTDATCRQMFKKHMEVMVNRRNRINGRVYKDDPTIFAWDLMNEPRCDCFPPKIPPPPEMVSCRPECAQKMQIWVPRGRQYISGMPAQKWIEEMSAHLKTLDANHMVTVGEEGFYGPGSVAEPVNPGTGWATLSGQNFSANHAPESIDFAAIHLWPDNWEIWDLDFLDQWIRQHAADAKSMGKPLLIEEFGKQVHIETQLSKASISSVRAPFYKKVYSTLISSLEQNDALRGVIFWQFGFEPYVSNTLFGKCRHCEAIQISASDSVFQNVIRPAAKQAAKICKAKGQVIYCSPAASDKRAMLIPHPLERPVPNVTELEQGQNGFSKKSRLARKDTRGTWGRSEHRSSKSRPRNHNSNVIHGHL